MNHIWYENTRRINDLPESLNQSTSEVPSSLGSLPNSLEWKKDPKTKGPGGVLDPPDIPPTF